MSSTNKARGTRWETAVLRFLRVNVDPSAYKPRQEGHADVGDIHAAGIVVQAKDWRSWEAAIRDGLDGAQRQAAAARRPLGVAVVKRARRPVGDAYAVMRLDDFARLLRAADNCFPGRLWDVFAAEAERLDALDALAFAAEADDAAP